MKTRRRNLLICLWIAGAVISGATAFSLLNNQIPSVDNHTLVNRRVLIQPDYSDTVIPPNIAPLNFTIKEPGKRYLAVIHGPRSPEIRISNTTGEIQIAPGKWRRLLEKNRGQDIWLDIYAQTADGQWSRFPRITNRIANEEIDRYMVYREMPAYNMIWKDMAIHQRDLQTGKDTLILHNSKLNEGCLNCHTFCMNDPDTMLFHIRSEDYGKASVLYRNGKLIKLLTKTDFHSSPAVYTQWHPGGEALAFSVNNVIQLAHAYGANRDVIDAYSDLAVYLFESNTITSTPEISRLERLETYPVWSPDGKYLYFCSAPRTPVEKIKELRYSLMRISYDLETGRWGDLETVLSADETELSITAPRFSPDGGYLLFCMAKYGNFPAFRPSSDLYLMEVETREYRRLDISSEHADAHHSWSRDGRWVVFSSKRPDGFFAKPYFSYVNEKGEFCKPFVLPQRDPAFYASHIRIFNRPELITKPIPLDRRQIAAAVHSDDVIQAKLDPAVTWKRAPSEVPQEETSRSFGKGQE